jgi:fermentation-respiration switch protein FrsA (DUF1100 family)
MAEPIPCARGRRAKSIGWPEGTRPGLAILAVALLLASGCTRTVTETDLFHPRAAVLADPPPDAQPLRIERPDGTRLAGWLLTVDHPVATLVYCGGNAETVADSWSRLRWLSSTLSVEVVALDYRGYGASGGTPTLRACAEDAVAAVDAARSLPGHEHARLLVYGRSLGGGMATYAAANRELAGLVLEAPPASCPEVVRAWNRQLPWYVRWCLTLEPDAALSAPELQPILLARQLRCPLLLIHGDVDTVIAQEQGLRLYRAAASMDKTFLSLPGTGHNDVRIDTDPVRAHLVAFVCDHAPGP